MTNDLRVSHLHDVLLGVLNTSTGFGSSHSATATVVGVVVGVVERVVVGVVSCKNSVR